MYTSLSLRREQFIKSYVMEGLAIASSNTIEGSQIGRIENILNLYDISSIISFKKLYLPHFKLTQTLKDEGLVMYTYQYQRGNNAEFYVPTAIKQVETVEEFKEKMYTGTLSENETVVEGISQNSVQVNTQTKLDFHIKKGNYLSGTIKSKKSTFIVFRKKWYPEWRIEIDGKKQRYYRTNLTHIGFFVPSGTHTFELKYIPSSFIIGSIVSLGSLIIGALVFTLKTFQRRK